MSDDPTVPPDLAIAELARRQHGVVARRQLLRVGLSPAQIRVRVRRGSLHGVYRGVYSVGHRAAGVFGPPMAAVLACGPEAVLSHRSAGWLLGIVPPSTGFPEVTRATGWQGPRDIRLHRSSIPADERCVVDGIPTTGLARTLLDLAAGSSLRQLEQAWNEAAVRGLTDRLSVPTLLERYPRRPGTVVLQRLLDDARAALGVTRHELEARFKEELGRTDLPRPRLNADVAVRGRFFEADCLWAEQRVIVELDGRATHGTGQAFEKDRERDRLLQSDGWRVIRVTWRQLRDDGPAVIADLRRVLRNARRTPTL